MRVDNGAEDQEHRVGQSSRLQAGAKRSQLSSLIVSDQQASEIAVMTASGSAAARAGRLSANVQIAGGATRSSGRREDDEECHGTNVATCKQCLGKCRFCYFVPEPRKKPRDAIECVSGFRGFSSACASSADFSGLRFSKRSCKIPLQDEDGQVSASSSGSSHWGITILLLLILCTCGTCCVCCGIRLIVRLLDGPRERGADQGDSDDPAMQQQILEALRRMSGRLQGVEAAGAGNHRASRWSIASMNIPMFGWGASRLMGRATSTKQQMDLTGERDAGYREGQAPAAEDVTH